MVKRFVIGLPVIFLAAIPLTLFDGVIIQLLWRWFVAHPFHIARLSLATAIGLSLLVSYLTFQISAVFRNRKDKWLAAYQLGRWFLIAVATLSTGALVHLFQ